MIDLDMFFAKAPPYLMDFVPTHGLDGKDLIAAYCDHVLAMTEELTGFCDLLEVKILARNIKSTL